MVHSAMSILKTVIRLVLIWCLLIYPGLFCIRMISDPALRRGDIPSFVVDHFKQVSLRYEKWGKGYLGLEYATKVNFENCAATEWPMFGSVYYLLAAEEIHRALVNRNDVTAHNIKTIIQRVAKVAAQIVADSRTGSWVKNKWGPAYRTKENVFYRMLMIMGLSSYETITGDKAYRSLLSEQTVSLARELSQSPTYLLDDYPGECYPNDVLWAVAGIRRADRLLGTDHASLPPQVLNMLNTQSLTREGLPAYAVDSKTGAPVSPARGCANSGILVFVPELDSAMARFWYGQHEKHFLQSNGFCLGFREYPRNYHQQRRDVDTGPIIGDFGSVASLFAIGSARAIGRLDHSVPLTMEILALSLPTPFGLFYPSLLSYAGAQSSSLGEIAILFLVTRPVLVDVTHYAGSAPGVVWAAIIIYLGSGVFLLVNLFREFLRKR